MQEPTPPGQRKDNRDSRARAREERKQANRLDYAVRQAIDLSAKLEQTDGRGAEAMLSVAILDLSATGLSLATIADRLQRPRAEVERLYAGAMEAVARRQTIAAEQVRYQTTAKLADIDAQLAALLATDDLEATPRIRALEVRARVAMQVADLYAAKVRDTDASLADAVADVLRTAAQHDRDGIGTDAPAEVNVSTSKPD